MSERWRGENIHEIRENTQRGRGLWGEEHSLWGGSDEKGLGEGLGTFSLLLLCHLNPPTCSVLHPGPPEPFAYSPGSGKQNQGRTWDPAKKSGGQGCVGEGLE